MKTRFHLLASSLILLGLGGCFHDSDDDDMMMDETPSYQVKLINLTNGQPMTPVAVIAHKAGYHAWHLGAAASTGLEKLAEGGDTSDFLDAAMMNDMVITTATAGSGPFLPGSSEMTTIKTSMNSDLHITVASMLANTNDAFTGALSVDVSDLAKGESKAMLTHVYDAGTEANTETAGTLPASGGQGFNSTRDDSINKVLVHAGVVTEDDGLTSSDLGEEHRWNGPAAKLVISRIQ